MGSFGHTASASVASDNPSAWKLTFNDDFNGSALDSDNWAHRAPGVRNDAINTPAAVSVDNGLLTIKTYTDAGTHYTGMIGSQGKFEQTYGYYEARIKFHTTQGQWSAFWMTSPVYDQGSGNPGFYGTEIDIVEHRAQNTSNNDIRDRFSNAIHWDTYAEGVHKQDSKVFQDIPDLGNDSWHTWGVKWSPAGYEFYYDDKLMRTVTQAVSARDEYLILSSEVRNLGWAGDIPAGGYGSFANTVTNMQVDYVRVYEAIPEPGSLALLAVTGMLAGRRCRD
jgi:beta-glucanase (GH16 family)